MAAAFDGKANVQHTCEASVFFHASERRTIVVSYTPRFVGLFRPSPVVPPRGLGPIAGVEAAAIRFGVKSSHFLPVSPGLERRETNLWWHRNSPPGLFSTQTLNIITS